MQKLLTISVAAYNIEKYIDKMAQSIIQSNVLDMIEVLIVNDGSHDRTSEIAKIYQDKYPSTFRLISKENGGHGSTINRGIDEAKGKYFRALDGDDWVHSEHLENLVKQMEVISSDIILSDYCKCFENGRNEVIAFNDLISGKTYPFDEIAPKSWMCYHTVIYRTELLRKHNIRLDEKCFYVDTEFMLFPIPYVNTVYYAKDYIYCYRLGLTDQSVSPESRMKHISHSKKVAETLLIMYQRLNGNSSKIKKDYICSGIAEHCIWHIFSLLLFPQTIEKKQEIILFDRKIQEESPEIYYKMGEMGKYSRSVKALRYSGYFLYPLVNWYQRRKVIE